MRLFVFFLVLFCSCHPLLGFFEIDPKPIIVLLTIVIFFTYGIKVNINSSIVLILILSLLFLVFGFIKNFHLKVFLLLMVQFYLAYFLKLKVLNKDIYYKIFNFNLIICSLSTVWFILAQFYEVPMIAEVPNPEKDKSIYVTFFGTTNSLNPLRPSGIFDEPGSLVYWNILWMIIGIKKYNLTRNKVLMNFFLLLCTGSLALLIFIIIYLFKSFGKKVIQSGLALLGIFLLIPNNLSTRINFDYITENNRMKQFYNISENLNVDVLIYGWEYVYGSTEEVGDVSSIILSITFIYGALLSIIVLYLLGYLISKINTENWHLALIFLALVIQRPYFFSLYWSIPLFISYLFIIESNENTSNRIVLRE